MDTNVDIDATFAQEKRGHGPYLASLSTDTRVSLATRVGCAFGVDCLGLGDWTAGAIRLCVGVGVSGETPDHSALADCWGSRVHSATGHTGVHARGCR